MKISRRKFLELAPLAGVAAASAAGVAAGQSTRSDRPLLAKQIDLMTLANFSGAVNTEFVFQRGVGDGVVLTLDAAEDSMRAFGERIRHGGENFVLTFSAPAGQPIRQGMYSVRHKTLGRFDLFITEGKSDADARGRYLAVVNILKK